MPDTPMNQPDSEEEIIDVPIPSLSISKDTGLQKQQHELVRLERKIAGWLAKGILFIFGAVSLILLIWVLVCSSFDKNATDALEMAKTILPYLATPLGVALGYYFTRQTK